MGAPDWGSVPINSTGAVPIAAGSTTALFAELDSTRLGTAFYVGDRAQLFQVRYTLGGDTNITWQVGSCSSTELADGVDEIFIKTPTGQTGQYVHELQLKRNYRIRARQASSGANGVAHISAVPLT
jgi:hypothetical protein